MPQTLTTGQAAKLLGVARWRIARLYEEGDLPEPKAGRCGRNRIIARDELPAIIAALSKRGWLRHAVDLSGLAPSSAGGVNA